MGTGSYDTYWGKPRDTPEQLRVLAMYEFDPPLSSQELVGALRACNNRTDHAYQYLKASRRHHQRSIVIPASAPAATTNTRMTTPEREKRRLSASLDDKGTPNKRHKDQSFSQMDTEEKEEEKHDKDTPDTQQDTQMQLTAADYTRAQQLLLETVEDRVAGTQPLRNPDWVNQVWTSLQVPAVLELAMHLNLTVDALATWVKDVESQYAQDIQTRGVALIVEVAASLPSYTTNPNESVALQPKDEVLTKHDDEVSAIAKAESHAAELSAYARANAAKSAIQSLSSACKAYMDRLAWFAQSGDKSGKETADAGKVLETLDLKLEGLVDICTHDVKEAESTLVEAKQKKGTRSLQIVDFVNKRRQELLDKGETEACATLDSVIGVWKKDDVEVQALWSSRSECEKQVEESVRALTVAEHALAFHKNLHILFHKVCERREDALTRSSKGLEQARATSEARATSSLELFIPMLTRALGCYYEFHSIQQAKAKEELQEQEIALAAHNEYFGDSAPMKKGDIEQRIREFIGVTKNSMQVVLEIAGGQQELWEDKQTVLPGSVRQVLLCEFKSLWMQLSGPMQSVMKKFVTTIEEAASGAVAVQLQEEKEPQPDPAAPVFVTANALDEQVVPAFTVPTFTHSQAEAITPYRTAISAVVATNDVSTSPGSQRKEKKHEHTLASVRAIVAAAVQQTSEHRKSRHEFNVGAILYSKITVGENCTQFVRGVVLKQLDNGMYLMQYDNGDKFSVGSSFLFTKELMEESLKAGGVAGPDQDAEMEDADRAEQAESGCAIM